MADQPGNPDAVFDLTVAFRWGDSAVRPEGRVSRALDRRAPANADEEENMVRLAEQMVRECFRRMRDRGVAT